jgi:hypothetical protein
MDGRDRRPTIVVYGAEPVGIREGVVMRLKPVKEQVVVVIGAFTPALTASLKIRLSRSPAIVLARLVGRVAHLGRVLGDRVAGAICGARLGALPPLRATHRHVAAARVLGKRAKARKAKAKRAHAS